MVYRRSKRTPTKPYRRKSYTPPTRRTYKRRSTPRRSMKAACKCPVEMSPAARWAYAQLDPFDTTASGAKIPDSNTLPSIANSDTDIVSLQASAATFLSGVAFRPQYTWGTVQATAGVSLNWGAGWSNNAVNRDKRVNYATIMELTRPCAHAVRMSSPVAPTTATGFVHIGLASETSYNQNTWDFPTTVAQMSGLQHYKRVTLASLTQSPLTVINKWLDDTGFRYSSPASEVQNSNGANFQSDFGWATIVVIVEGGPTTGTLLSFEHILLSEGIPMKTSVIIGTPAATNSPGTMGAVGEMTVETDPFHTESEQESYISRGVQAMASGAAQAGEAVFQQVGIPLLNQIGSRGVGVAASMAYNALTGTGGISGVNSNPNRLAIQ